MQYTIFFPYAHQVVCDSDDGTTKIVYGGESLNRTSLLASLDFPGSGKPGNPSYFGSVMSSFCRDSNEPHASSQCLFVKKGGYQFIYLYFSLYKNFMLMVKSYLMRGYIFHN